MEFRIRKDTDNDAEFKAGQKAYVKHLGRFNKTSNSDLWKFFYWDFFHDGDIKYINISADLKKVSIKLGAPNIKRFLPSGDFEYKNVDFVCTFHNVIHLEINNKSISEWLPYNAQPATFLAAEINTSPMLAEMQVKDEFYSLLIEAMAGDNVIWLELVFSQVDVEAEEPVAFSFMEANSQFEIPVYHPEEKGESS